MSLKNDKWKSPAWQFQTKAQAHEDLLGSKSDETDGVVDVAGLYVASFGTALAGLGAGLTFDVENGAGEVEERASIDVVATTVTNGSEAFDMVFNIAQSGTVTEIMRLDASADSVVVAGNMTVSGTLGVTGATTESAAKTISVDNATANAVTDVLTVAHTTSGTPANGIGVGIAFNTENDAPETLQIASIDATLTDVTDGAEYGDLILSTMINNTVTAVLTLDGSLGMLDIKDPGTASTAALDSAADVDDWLEIRLGGTQMFIPLVAAT